MNSTPGHGLSAARPKLGVESEEAQMHRHLSIAGICCVTLACVLTAFGSTHRSAKKQAPVATPPPATQPAIPEPPPTPEQMPAVAPKVTMNGGELSIVAENSTMGDVLSAVKTATGAAVEAPAAANNDRVVVHLGPGQPQQVLQQLLAGSRFDYIILGSSTNPAAVDKIILTARGSGGSSGPMAGQPSAMRPSAPQVPDYQADSGGVDDEITQPEPQQQEEVTPPEQGAEQRQIGPGGEAQQNQNQQGPKTPEQLLQELQRLQQQQQQNGQAPPMNRTPR